MQAGTFLTTTQEIASLVVGVDKGKGYDWRFSAAITAASSTIGPVIPPSIPLVIYGYLTEVSVGRLFLAGVIPGALMGLALMVAVYLVSRYRQYPRDTRWPIKEILQSGKAAFLPLMTAVLFSLPHRTCPC